MKIPAISLGTAALALLLALPALAQRGAMGERIIQRLDTDGDGKVSFDEFQPPGPGAGNRMAQADANGDGMITMDEMNAAMAARMEQMKDRMMKRHNEMQQRMREHFKEMDTNDDGALTAEEMRHGAFAKMDKNGDGYLTADEFKPRRMHRPGMHRPGMDGPGMDGPDEGDQ